MIVFWPWLIMLFLSLVRKWQKWKSLDHTWAHAAALNHSIHNHSIHHPSCLLMRILRLSQQKIWEWHVLWCENAPLCCISFLLLVGVGLYRTRYKPYWGIWTKVLYYRFSCQVSTCCLISFTVITIMWITCYSATCTGHLKTTQFIIFYYFKSQGLSSKYDILHLTRWWLVGLNRSVFELGS